MSLNSTPRTWAPGEVVTAAMLNAEIRDALAGIQAAWTSYTPALTGITLANGTLTGAYLQVGKTVTACGLFQAGSSTTYSGNFTVSLPVAAAAAMVSSSFAVGSGIANATGTRFAVVAGLATTTTLSFALPSGGTVSATAPGTWNASGVLGWTVTYQAA